ncbi:CrcB family protein [uncultured Pseudokineococcus sp.]|uniref:fluoride efflux transporter FluC n=1 Tax=uncultured Pseudokineococcus sp. TaxID=1642928 RepID=UPI002629E126|nr:CrcB family protein [uncultured Pseudokineococcus sp.]
MSGAVVVLVALAGGVGAVVRVVVDGEVRTRLGGRLPWGTAVVNVLGSLLIGLVTGLLGGPAAPASDAAAAAVLATGVCGGFTTFGTAVVEVLRLLEQRRVGAAAAAAAATVVVSTLAAALGLVLGRAL